MRTNTCIWVSPGDRSRLERLVSDRNTPQKHVWRARIVLLSWEGLGTMEIMRRVGKSKPTVWRWQQRYLAAGVDGLLRDRPRGPGKPALGGEVISLVLTKTLGDKPPKATHWSLRTMAKAVGIGHSSVQRIWAKHGLKPHLVSTFKVSNDPKLAEKVADVVGLYLNPPDKALVYSMDEKSQIQALDRTQPGLPMKKGRAGTMTHDYKRNGTTTLFAPLNVLDGTVIGQCQKRHRHQEFLGFLRKLDRETPKSLDLHLIVDNYATHKHAKVKEWLAKHPPLPFPLHANLGVLAELGGTVLRRNNQGRHPPRRLQERPRTGGGHQRLPRQTQRYSQTLRLDRHRPRHSRKDRSRTAGLEPCEGGYLLNESEH